MNLWIHELRLINIPSFIKLVWLDSIKIKMKLKHWLNLLLSWQKSWKSFENRQILLSVQQKFLWKKLILSWLFVFPFIPICTIKLARRQKEHGYVRNVSNPLNQKHCYKIKKICWNVMILIVDILKIFRTYYWAQPRLHRDIACFDK